MYLFTSSLKKIPYQMTDATSHCLKVGEMVALDLGVDCVPEYLFCQTHPCLMFNREVLEVFRNIERSMSPEKLYSGFLSSVTNHHTRVFEQYIDCLTRLVSSDYDHKSWNYANEFKLFIAPKKNLAISLKQERFNRFVYVSAIVIYTGDDVERFLDT